MIHTNEQNKKRLLLCVYNEYTITDIINDSYQSMIIAICICSFKTT